MPTRNGRFEPSITVFMLVKTTPERLGFTAERRNELARTHLIRLIHIWMWDAEDHHAYEMLVEALRETAFRDRWFSVVEIFPGVEEAYARNHDRDVVTV